MAKNTFLDWDQTASNNTDIGGIGILGTNAVSNFDDAFRTLMAQLRAGVDGEVVYAAKSGNYTAVLNDNNAWHRYTATATITLTAAATLGANWHYYVQADGGTVTIDPNGAETINGATTLVLQSGQTASVICTGSAFIAIVEGTVVTGPGQQGYLYGLTLANNASDATNDIDIATGVAASDTSPYYLMQLTSALTKRLDANWAVGTGNGGLDTGSIANTTYHIWLIQRSDTGVVDALFSASATSPTMPTNYDRKRLIMSIMRVSGAIRGFVQTGDEVLYKGNSVVDVSATNPGAVATARTVSVPLGIEVEAYLRYSVANTASAGLFDTYFSYIGVTSDTPTTYRQSAAPVANASGRQREDAGEVRVRTNTSAQIRSSHSFSDASCTLTLTAYGFRWDRGRI